MYRGISRSLLLVLGLAAVLVVPTPSFAQMYIGVYTGAVIPHDADTDFTDRARQDLDIDLAALFGPGSLSSLTITDLEFDAGVMVGGRVGYWLEGLDMPFLGFEVEVYGGFPKLSAQTITEGLLGTFGGGTVVGSLSLPIAETDVDMVTVGFNALLRYPSGPIQPYVGAGLGIVHAEIDDVKLAVPIVVTAGGASAIFPAGFIVARSDDDTAPALQLIGGVRGFISDNVALFAEYKWVTAEFELAEFEIDYNASHVYGGLEFYFGPGVHKE